MKILYLDEEKKIEYLRSKQAEGKFRNGKSYSILRNFPLPVITGFCQVCGRRKAYCWHHIRPLSRGGSNSDNNLIKICNECHHKVHPFMS